MICSSRPRILTRGDQCSPATSGPPRTLRLFDPAFLSRGETARTRLIRIDPKKETFAMNLSLPCGS